MATIEQQAEIARTMTGSKLSTEEIVIRVQNIDPFTKEKACPKVHQMVLEYNLPFDKAFPIIRNGFSEIAKEHKINPAVLFWIYMDWMKENNINHQ